MKVLSVVGARPNFMKVAPLKRELEQRGHESKLVHTGQHYDSEMSKKFLKELDLGEPDVHLGVGSDTHARQTASVMTEIEPVLQQENPDWLIVVGDVNSTMAAALVGSKLDVKVAHVEAGIRSGNWNMPEEVNRAVTDRISDALFCFDEEAVENLTSEGVPEEKIHLVGDIMIDSLKFILDQRNGSLDHDLPEEYAVLTLHRPANVDTEENLNQAYEILSSVNEEIPLVFPVHPRTKNRLEETNQKGKWDSTFELLPPLNYGDFVGLMQNARVVLTDSGSIQQETTVMNVPCLTLREETERSITVRKGTNELVGMDRTKIKQNLEKVLNDNWKNAEEIPYWDGSTASRIVDTLEASTE